MAHDRVLGMDTAKQIFHPVGLDETGTVVLRKHGPPGYPHVLYRPDTVLSPNRMVN
jgi:hypothetical protein